MSEVKEENTGAGGPALEPQATVTPKLLKVYGREFNIGTPEGFLQAQTWAEAMSTLVGKQSTEIGSLRKFKADMAPTENESELLSKADEFRSLGEHRKADELLLGYAKQAKAKADRKLKDERENDATWEQYFESRKELLDWFPKDTIKKVSEAQLGIYDVDNPFAVLDAFWTPRMKRTGEPKMEAPKLEQPPVTLSGGAPKPVAPKTEEPKVPTVDEVLASHPALQRR